MQRYLISLCSGTLVGRIKEVEREQKLKRQLILVSDMEGASGIFEGDEQMIINGEEEWRSAGRKRMTSDDTAVIPNHEIRALKDLLDLLD